jgi:hypothetical protein
MKVLYVIVFDNKGPVMQSPVPKGRTVTAKFYKNIVLKDLKSCYKRRRLSTGIMFPGLLHDNAHAHKARLVTEFFASEKVIVLPHPLFSPELAPCDVYLFPKLKFRVSEKKDASRELPFGLLFISTNECPH